MKWQDLQKKLIDKKDKEVCFDFAVACAEKAASLTDLPLVIETPSVLKANRWLYSAVSERFQPLTKIRISHKDDLIKRESAHVMIHAIELSSVKSIQSMAAHAARCGEALSRIDERFAEEICLRFAI